MNYFPVFFDLMGQAVLVVGGGEVALRKVVLLERSGAAITLVAPQVHPELQERGSAGKIKLVSREFVPDDLNGARLVIVATSRRAVNRWIATLSEARNIPVNVVDDREASRFIVPAIIDRDPVLVAISTGGTSPVLARRLRERLEAAIPKKIGELALWLRALRDGARRRLRNTDERRRFFENIVDGAAARRFIEGDVQAAQRLAQQLLGTTAGAPRATGDVTLVGAGPGDPELLTLKALRALQDADVILHDRLVPETLLDMARRDAARICVGKAAGSIGSSQQEINALLIEYALQGKRVVRLKGGDPFIFGRGGEELEALGKAKIPFSVIPGITAASGCAAYAGIPLTHRNHAHSVTFVTGHADKDGREPDWRALAQPGMTAVFYMGLARLEHIAARLTEHGAPAGLPAAIIAQGTLPDQRVITGTLSTLPGLVAHSSVQSPALLVVGEVVSLHDSLAWFHSAVPAEASRSA
ncbi:MAG: uroporphyrin-III C-methyltransferase / precorrin-2 dehydrogenase / sirohydrochlorin ferrochelatase [Gammaproteobacteria bacterium]|jgi:uroporphyrin-III C-methyltransferase/precorrin-2 dehydrogenase/sirohydrochlorin ferrochelatase|nr:uroporphyrin-III C-methyltransferase / precorrin-2 dehydrogenase / sirohydrochlorin ferrochelatase [Gammaproteobacteria bacterium]